MVSLLSRLVRPSADASEVLLCGRLGDAEAAGEEPLRQVVSVQGSDVLLGRDRDGLLRLNDFDVARDAGREPVARLRELLRRQLARAGRDLELFVGRLQIEK